MHTIKLDRIYNTQNCSSWPNVTYKVPQTLMIPPEKNLKTFVKSSALFVTWDNRWLFNFHGIGNIEASG